MESRKQGYRNIDTETLVDTLNIRREREQQLFEKWNKEYRRGNVEKAREIRDKDKLLLEQMIDITEVLEERGVELATNEFDIVVIVNKKGDDSMIINVGQTGSVCTLGDYEREEGRGN